MIRLIALSLNIGIYNFLQEKFKSSTYAIFGYKYLEYRFSNNDKDQTKTSNNKNVIIIFRLMLETYHSGA